MSAEELGILLDFWTVFCDSIKVIFTVGVEFHQGIVFLIIDLELHESACKCAYLYGFLNQSDSSLLHRDSFGTFVTNLNVLDLVCCFHAK